MRLIWDGPGGAGGVSEWGVTLEGNTSEQEVDSGDKTQEDSNDTGNLTAAVNCIFVLMHCFPAQKTKQNTSCFGSLIRTIFVFHLTLGEQIEKGTLLLCFERAPWEAGEEGYPAEGLYLATSASPLVLQLSVAAPPTAYTLSGRRLYLNGALQTLKQHVWFDGGPMWLQLRMLKTDTMWVNSEV